MKTATLLLSLSLAACVGAPQLKPSDVKMPDRYTDEPLPGLSMQAGEVVPAQWWTRFNSPELNATVGAALAGNRNLAAAQASLKQAQELLAASRGARLPSAELAASGGRQKYGAAFLGNNASAFPAFTAYSIGVNVSYVLDYAGGVRSGVRQRQALADVQRSSLDAAQLALIGNVVLQAFEVAAAREQIRAVEGIVDEDNRNLSLVQRALEAGSVARVDLLTAQSQLAQDQTLLPPLRQQLSAARHALAVLVGQPPGGWSPPDFELSAFVLPVDIPLVLPSQLAQRRPDIRADEARVRAAAAAVGVATANLYPQLKLSGSLAEQAVSVSTLFDEGSTAFTLLGNLTAPLFNGGRLRAERRASIAAGQAALAQYEQTVLVAFGQIADVLTALEHDAEQITAQEQALSVAESNLSLTRESYSAGNVGVLQILDAERAAQRARLGVVRARAQRLADTAELMVGLGGESIPAAAR